VTTISSRPAEVALGVASSAAHATATLIPVTNEKLKKQLNLAIARVMPTPVLLISLIASGQERIAKLAIS
jgi:hypothetical protein